jgi:hypothetical protein
LLETCSLAVTVLHPFCLKVGRPAISMESVTFLHILVMEFLCLPVANVVPNP